ncbi:MAG: sodium/proton-translocating pyrophosphatase [Fimbriimonadaceae bacterium]|nr:sodium/proton-translocating pyrophosphatase [Fimbriimonadaceae bacterium]
MAFNELAKRTTRSPFAASSGLRGLGRWATLLSLIVCPAAAFAAEGDRVKLSLGGELTGYLIGAMVLAFVALAYAGVLVQQVMRESAGPESMQSVGRAIKDGALAYLRQQIGTMSIFAALLFVGLFLLYLNSGPIIAGGVAVAFAAGLAGSYIAGYTGMVVAVNGNMRVAFAATTSYRKALEVAFRSGAVAGLVTVGIGLLGASVILLAGGEGAVRYLVGFGFGGSLAALFMRVGGGIFTKAADVGADLVGKVEAGIPEDDPRNPAVIADNVGDNVGDCAGMAADVFESFAVTLISAIVLAAATANVFDVATWNRLVVFAILTAAVGLVASIVGIASVKGTDDMNVDPLVIIRRGFNTTAVLGLLGTAIVAFLLFGGKPIETARLQSVRTFERNEAQAIQDLRGTLAKLTITTSVAKAAAEEKAKELKRPVKEITALDLYSNPKTIPASIREIPRAIVARALAEDKSEVKPYDITAEDIIRSAAGKQRGYKDEDLVNINQALNINLAQLPEPPNLQGYRRVTNPADPTVPALNYAVPSTPTPDDPNPKPYTTVAAAFLGTGKDKLVLKYVQVKAKIPGQPAANGMPAAEPRDVDQKQWIGPIKLGVIEQQIEQQRKQVAEQSKTVKGFSATIEDLKTLPVTLYANSAGKLAIGIPSEVERPQMLRSLGTSYFPVPVATMETLSSSTIAGVPRSTPPLETIEIAVASGFVVPWYTFVIAFAIGLLLAIAIEKLTEYYVSTTKKPTNEVAGVSSGGAAPMIIQGFAYASESGAMMTGIIVAALICPILLFPTGIYGGYEIALYGVALVGLGLLSTTGYVLAMDTFGPISDNAQGVYEMSGAAEGNESGAAVVSKLDAAGNTTKALTKGFAIATAVVAAIALFNSYRTEAELTTVGLKLDVPEIFLGLLIGGAAPLLFSAFAINAVGRSSFELINEVRRQFREFPGIMNGTEKPDYARCVAIVTSAAQRELLAPGILAIALPVAVGFGFSIGKPTTMIDGREFNLTGAQALGGFLAGAILVGQLMAVLLSNAGGMWDNAKKLIEDGKFGGKGSENHRASVICDTVGDPFKDTAGPALNPLIKVMNLVALLLAGVIIMPIQTVISVAITVAALVALAYAVWTTKQGSFADSLNQVSPNAEPGETSPNE